MGKSKGGRPTIYDPERHPIIARCLAREGSTIKEIAKMLRINTDTAFEWMNAHPAFSDAINDGRSLVDAMVEDSLYKRAVGCASETTETTFKLDSNGQPVPDKIIKREGRALPDTAAAIFWLKNRKPAKWRDRHESVVIGDASAAPVSVSVDDAFRELIKRDPKARELAAQLADLAQGQRDPTR